MVPMTPLTNLDGTVSTDAFTGAYRGFAILASREDFNGTFEVSVFDANDRVVFAKGGLPTEAHGAVFAVAAISEINATFGAY